jgi:hypothetical protein
MIMFLVGSFLVTRNKKNSTNEKLETSKPETLSAFGCKRLQLRIKALIPDDDRAAADFAIFDVALPAIGEIQHH